jgi:hypothetical protein
MGQPVCSLFYGTTVSDPDLLDDTENVSVTLSQIGDQSLTKNNPGTIADVLNPNLTWLHRSVARFPISLWLRGDRSVHSRRWPSRTMTSINREKNTATITRVTRSLRRSLPHLCAARADTPKTWTTGNGTRTGKL